MSWWETLHLVTWWKRLGISAIKTGQDAPSWIWCTERLSFFWEGHIVLQRFVHVLCHFQPLPTKLVFAYFDRGSYSVWYLTWRSSTLVFLYKPTKTNKLWMDWPFQDPEAGIAFLCFCVKAPEDASAYLKILPPKDNIQQHTIHCHSKWIHEKKHISQTNPVFHWKASKWVFLVGKKNLGNSWK